MVEGPTPSAWLSAPTVAMPWARTNPMRRSSRSRSIMRTSWRTGARFVKRCGVCAPGARDAQTALVGARCGAVESVRARRMSTLRPLIPEPARDPRRSRHTLATASIAATDRQDIDILVIGEINPDIVVSDPDPVPVFDEVERVIESVHMTVGSSSAIFACGAARLDLAGRVLRRRRGRCVRSLHAGRDVRARDRRLGLPRGSGAAHRVDGHPHERPGPGDPHRDGRDRGDGRGRRPAVPARTGSPRPLGLLLPPGDEPRSAAGVLRVGAGPRDHDLLRHELGSDRDAGTAGVAEMLRACDIFFPNAAEARRIARLDDVEEAARALARIGPAGRTDGGPIVAVKLGAAGALACRAEGPLRPGPGHARRAARHDRCRRLLQRGVPARLARRGRPPRVPPLGRGRPARSRPGGSAGSTVSRRWLKPWPRWRDGLR